MPTPCQKKSQRSVSDKPAERVSVSSSMDAPSQRGLDPGLPLKKNCICKFISVNMQQAVLVKSKLWLQMHLLSKDTKV